MRGFKSQVLLAVFSFMLLLDGVWSIIVQFDDPFFPFQLGRLIRIGIGVCIGVMACGWKQRDEGKKAKRKLKTGRLS